MCFPTFSALGSLFLVISFIMELFLLIGQVSNTHVLSAVNYVVAWKSGEDLSYRMGLWNYCTGNGNLEVQSCEKGHPAYNWANTPGISDAVPDMASSVMVKSLFVAMFTLIFIACGFSFIFWVCSLPICFTRRRLLGASMTTLVFINFLIMLVVVILALVLVLSGIRHLTSADPTWDAHAGNSLWITIGACIALLISFICYCLATIFGRKNRKNKVDTGYKRESFNYPRSQSYVASPTFGNQNLNSNYNQAPNYTNQTPRSPMLQQSYNAASPNMGNQTNYANNPVHHPNPLSQTNISAPVQQGYQTPVLEHDTTVHH
ncbi:SUR7/PalI family-domain-containing protein [Pilobolus umbonatus]|nr:SUR7/PalI family-domain-containing protein [Pilobolus umbonatus]